MKLFFGALLLFLGLIISAWIIDWIFVFQVWPDGVARLQSILAEDLARVAQIRGSFDLAEKTANFLYALLFEATGVHGMGARFAEASALSIPDTVIRNAYVANFDAVRTAMIGTQLFGVRLASLVMVLPMFALVYCVASVDGLTERAIRRVRGGRESASLYHRAKHLQVVLLVTIVAAGLLVPASIDLRYIWLPAALLVALLARLQWTYYKKHL